MDGLLIDSEPLWQEAANEVFKIYGIEINEKLYENTIGLRTIEFLDYWIEYFKLDKTLIPELDKLIVDAVINKVKTKGIILPGVQYIFNFFKDRSFKIGLATSSPTELINIVVEILKIDNYLEAITSAENLLFGKPNPQVYINCADKLNSKYENCICFEDSINGMIAAKSAKMKCVVVPSLNQAKDKRWALADLQLSSLQNFGNLHLERLQF